MNHLRPNAIVLGNWKEMSAVHVGVGLETAEVSMAKTIDEIHAGRCLLAHQQLPSKRPMFQILRAGI